MTKKERLKKEVVTAKWQSRRWMLTVWGSLLLTTILILSFVTKYSPEWLSFLIPFLATLPHTYMASETYTKTKINLNSMTPPQIKLPDDEDEEEEAEGK